MDFNVPAANLPAIQGNRNYRVNGYNPALVVQDLNISRDIDHTEEMKHAFLKAIIITSTALAAIATLGGIALLSFSYIAAGTAIATTGAIAAAGGSSLIYYNSKNNVFDRVNKLRNKFFKASLRDTFKYDPQEIEGKDLFRKVIEKRTNDPQESNRFYTAIRQLRSRYINITQNANGDSAFVVQSFDATKRNLDFWKDMKLGEINNQHYYYEITKNQDLTDLSLAYHRAITPWNNFKNNQLNEICQAKQRAFQELDGLYHDLIDNLR